MPTRFFIGGNKFYESEEEAQGDLEHLTDMYGVPEEFFTVVKIHKEEPEEQLKPSATLH